MSLIFKVKENIKIARAHLIGLDPIFLRFYYKIHFPVKKGSIDEALNRYAKKNKDFYFIQAGGNDGFINDPIFRFIKKYRWKGIITEPQKDVFEKRLKKTYKKQIGVILENIAISDKTEEKILYKLSISNARWATGLAGFNKETLLKQIENNYVAKKAKKEGIRVPDNLEELISEEIIRTTTIADLMKTHELPRIDLLQLDTEGFDHEIIKTIDFAQFAPKLIVFENEHIQSDDLEQCHQLLIKNGYEVTPYGRDTLAVLNKKAALAK